MLKITEIYSLVTPVTDMAPGAEVLRRGTLGLVPTLVVGEAGGMQWIEYDIGSGTLSLGAGAPDWESALGRLQRRLGSRRFRRRHPTTPRAKGEIPYGTIRHTRLPHGHDSDPDGNTICIHKRKSK